ncbi:hypothetical protein SEVIR_9G158900v4 [Setaria viridis]|uniref:rRNA N-glycosidase n=1 Tax=Setaria viridis TaxID=4556 RepID=A0A4U6SVQ6_SETVI|nr:uncharacterized protein LOC117839775 [Setaria viridis]TKV92354.1 hypothetical protein SEVIR_9G158900v2 [Setaria viridis]
MVVQLSDQRCLVKAASFQSTLQACRVHPWQCCGCSWYWWPPRCSPPPAGDEDLTGPYKCEPTPSFGLTMVVPEQTGQQPRPCAIPVLELQRRPDGGKIALALRPYTLDIVAFANGQGRWHTFSNWRHLRRGGAEVQRRLRQPQRLRGDGPAHDPRLHPAGGRHGREVQERPPGQRRRVRPAGVGHAEVRHRRSRMLRGRQGVREKIRGRLDEQKGTNQQCAVT